MALTPQSEEAFTPEWVASVTNDYFTQEDLDPKDIDILSVQACKNEVQGILSTTYIVDAKYKNSEEEEEKDLSLFVKVPLKGDQLFETVNKRELIMFRDVLPKLQTFLDEECKGFFRLPMPRLIHAHYDGTGEKDVFVLENLLSEGYYNFTNEKCLDESHMKAVLDCLSYLHGTGLAYKKKVGGTTAALQEEFPGIEVQLQLDDLLQNA